MGNEKHGLWTFHSVNTKTYLNSKFRYYGFSNSEFELSSDDISLIYVLLRTAVNNKYQQLELFFNLIENKTAFDSFFSECIEKIKDNKSIKLFKEYLFSKNFQAACGIAKRAIVQLDTIGSVIKNKPSFQSSYIVDDYLMICSSSAFRRLQDKAQVYSLETHDFVRNRLTHSIEVAANCEKISSGINFTSILSCDPLIRGDFPLITRCGGLLHDIGNPPFGHFGEVIVRDFFKTHKEELRETLGDELLLDFIKFDGNAQAFRIATKLQYFGKKSSLCMTAAVLGGMIKYPFSSKYDYGKNKFGYFQSEEKVVDFLRASGTFVDYIRNPLSLILEASDDISYMTADLEDAIHKGLITFESFDSLKCSNDDICKGFYSELNSNFVNDKNKYLDKNVFGYDDIRKVFEYSSRPVIAEYRQRFIRSAIDKFTSCSEQIFVKGINITTEPNFDLLEDKYIPLKKELSNIVDKIYPSKEIVANEIRGYTILNAILEKYYDALVNSKIDFDNKRFVWDSEKKKYYEKIMAFVSNDFIKSFFNEIKDQKSNDKIITFYKMHLLLDFVSGMSDSYAEELYDILTK